MTREKEISIKDRNESTACEALMAGLRSAIVLKYMVLVKEDISYPDLITEIRGHIQAKRPLIWRQAISARISFWKKNTK